MTKRDELMARKIEIDEKLASARIDISEAKRIAWAEKVFLPPRKMSEMERNLAFLQRESQRLQYELRGDRKNIHAAKDEKGAMFMQEFFMVARRTLTPEQFKAIAREAESRLTSANPKDTAA